MKDRFFQQLIRTTVQSKNRPFFPGDKLVCKVQGDSFSLQPDGSRGPKPVVNFQITQMGEHFSITWSEAARNWIKIVLAMGCSGVWIAILAIYFSLAANANNKVPMASMLAAGFGITIATIGMYWVSKHFARIEALKIVEFVRQIASEAENPKATRDDP